MIKNIYVIYHNIIMSYPLFMTQDELRLAIDELSAAIDKQYNDKDYHKKLHETTVKLVDEIGSNENFQKMIAGALTPAVCIRENSDTLDELAKLLEEYDEKEDTQHGGIIIQQKQTTTT